MDKMFLELLVCPICKGKLIADKQGERLICRFDKVAYPVKQGTPILLIEEAQPLTDEEVKS